MLIIIRARVKVKQRNRPSSRTGPPAVSNARCSLGRLSVGTTTAELHVAGSILAYSAQTTHKQILCTLISRLPLVVDVGLGERSSVALQVLQTRRTCHHLQVHDRVCEYGFIFHEPSKPPDSSFFQPSRSFSDICSWCEVFVQVWLLGGCFFHQTVGTAAAGEILSKPETLR